MLLLTLLPVYAILFTANLEQAGRQWRLMTLASLLFGGSVMVLLGGGLLLGGAAAAAALPAEAQGQAALAGVLILGAGAAGLLLLLPAVRAAVMRALRLKMEAERDIHLVALVLSVWLVGGTLAVVALTAGLSVEALTEGQQLRVGDLWEQGVAFVLLALLGVGLGLRRGAGETAARLGLAWPTPRQLLLAGGLVLLLTAWDWAVTWLWGVVDPTSLEHISTISELLFAGLDNPLGALSIGLTAGIGEELLFRGAIQPRFGLLLATLLFTVGHTQYQISPALLSVFVSGLVLGVVRQRESTTIAILIHAGYNMLNALLTMGG